MASILLFLGLVILTCYYFLGLRVIMIYYYFWGSLMNDSILDSKTIFQLLRSPTLAQQALNPASYRR